MAKQYNWKREGGDMWNFEENPTLIGKYSEMKPANQAARQSSVITLKELDDNGEETGKTIKFWGSTVLDKHFETYEPGVIVKISYLGMAKGKTGTEYKNFVIDKDEPIQQ